MRRRWGRLALIGSIVAACVACRSSVDAGTWNARGDAQLTAGDVQAAIASYRRALTLRDAGDLRGRTLDARGLYRAYSVVNNYESALSYAGLAYQWSAKLGDRELRGKVLAGVVALLYDMGDLTAVEAVLPEAEQLCAPTTFFGLKVHEVAGLVELAHGRARIAEHDLGDVLQAAQAQHDPQFAAEATADLVDAQLAAHDLDAAAATLAAYPESQRARGEPRLWFAHVSAQLALARGHDDEAIALATDALKDAPGDWTGTFEAVRGRARWHAGRLAEAEASLRTAVESIEQQRAHTSLDSLKPWVIELQREPFEDLFRLYVQQGRVVDAFAVVQRATARSILDSITATQAAVGSIPEEINRAGDRATGLLALARSLSASRAVVPPGGADLVARLRGRYVFTYFRAGDHMWLIALRPGGDPSARDLGPVAELRARIDRWLADPARIDGDEPLARTLLPEDLRPAPGATLYVAADEPVRDVAFSALRVGGEYLVQQNPVAYVPAASIPFVARRDLVPGRAIVLGDPTGDLPAARAEALEVAAAVKGDALVGKQATRERLEQRGATVLHVAAHTALTARGPALVLADGKVDSGEVLDQRVRADVVVLTGCAAADPRGRDELAPLASAFLAAGSGAVIASRWSVEDAVAQRFTRAFYAARGTADPIAATAAAQRQLMSEGVPVSAWSTFVVLAAPQQEGASSDTDTAPTDRRRPGSAQLR